jgi:hypothetical protein
MTGKTVWKDSYPAGIFSLAIDLPASLASGIYLFRLERGTQSGTKRLVIQ